MAAQRTSATGAPAAGRRRASHSMDSVLTEAVTLLDEAGEAALTFRALATRLGGGVASIYWYVSNKDELLDRATDHVIAGVVAEIDRLPSTEDPIEDLRAIAVTLFDAVSDRPWLGAYFMRNTDVQISSLRFVDRLGRQTQRLDLTPRQRFDAATAVSGYVVGTAADLGQEPPADVVEGRATREEALDHLAEGWRSLDPEEFPFLHEVVEEFHDHDDREQFLAGLDLLLAGLRLQAER